MGLGTTDGHLFLSGFPLLNQLFKLLMELLDNGFLFSEGINEGSLVFSEFSFFGLESVHMLFLEPEYALDLDHIDLKLLELLGGFLKHTLISILQLHTTDSLKGTFAWIPQTGNHHPRQCSYSRFGTRSRVQVCTLTMMLMRVAGFGVLGPSLRLSCSCIFCANSTSLLPLIFIFLSRYYIFTLSGLLWLIFGLLFLLCWFSFLFL